MLFKTNIYNIVYVKFDCCTLQAEEMRLYGLEETANNPDAGGGDLKKSMSDLSCTSVELYVPKRPATDKECISMKSDCGMDTRRRMSIINNVGKKVEWCNAIQQAFKREDSYRTVYGRVGLGMVRFGKVA